MAQDYPDDILNDTTIAIIEYTSRAFVHLLFQPLQYASVLAQLGHEPLPPSPGHTLTGKPALYYPNLFRYMGHINDVDGFFGLYRGMWPSLANTLALNLTNENLLLAADLPESDDTMEELAVFVQRLEWVLLCRALSVLITHPLRVETVRCMAQFVGREERYDGLFTGLLQVYRDGGFLGMWDGVVPRLLSDLLVLLFAQTVTFGVERLVLKHGKYREVIYQICGIVALSMTYSLRLVSTTIMVSGCGLAAGQEPNMPVYENWKRCYWDLMEKGQLARGGVFWRVANKK